MEDKIKNIIYRLYGLAESCYWTHYKEFIDREEVVAYGDQDDPEWCCDEWTMLRSDYNMIQDIKDALEEYYKDIAAFALPLEGNYMFFGEFIDKKRADIWDNCRYSGNWICLYKIFADTVIVRVCNKKPNIKESGFDWTGFIEGEDYEDVSLDRDGVLFKDPVKAIHVCVADSFWDFGQTFSPD